MGITTELVHDLCGIKTLKEDDRAALRTLILDFFAAAYAGYKQNRAFNDAVEKIVYSQGGAEEATVFLQERRYPAAKAAFMNALYGHGAELDDGNKKAMGHIGVHVIPAAFAVAEEQGSSQDDVLTALAIGYEAFIRLSSAAQPGMVQRGFHSTGMAGTMACAAACARLLNLDEQGMEDAVALATTMTGGLLSYGDSRPAIKPLNPAKAAENGVFAAQLARAGVRGPTESLEGPNGWFHAVTEHINEEMLKGSEDGHLLLRDCYYKLYPSCRHTHCGIEAAINLRDRVSLEEIAKVNVYIYPNAIKLAGIKYPKDQDETKFSIYYTLAVALCSGAYGIDNMDPAGMDDQVLSLIEKIELIPDGSMEDRSKGIRGTRVEIVTKDNRVETESVLVPKGDPEKPLTRDDIFHKLRVCAKNQAQEWQLERLAKAVVNIGGEARFVNPMMLLR